MSEQLLFIHNISRLITPQSVRRHDLTRPLNEIPNAGILVRGGKIAELGQEKELLPVIPDDAERFDAEGKIALPGLVDCHTHPVFVGNRAGEFHARNAGKSYLEIAAAGGGIQATARLVRNASVEQIVQESLPRFDRSLMCGVTTIEAKTGYGLEWEGEQKLLRALEIVSGQIPQRTQRTFLVHALPESARENRSGFVAKMAEEHMPFVAENRLATNADVFCEEGAFTVDESRVLLEAAKRHGLRLTIHANQFGHSGGAMLAAELQARSADHLEHLNDEEIHALADAKVAGVVLPACVFFLGTIPYPPARKMIESGMRIAVATDMNPGSSMTESLPFCMTAAAVYCHLSPAELLWATTFDAASVLGMESSIGSLEVGKFADISLWNIPNLDSLSYCFGDMRASTVFVDGVIAWEDRDSTSRY